MHLCNNIRVILRLKAGKIEDPNSLPDLQKKNDENKNRKLAKLRQIFPKCVNK